jgi:hypothetical protein
VVAVSRRLINQETCHVLCPLSSCPRQAVPSQLPRAPGAPPQAAVCSPPDHVGSHPSARTVPLQSSIRRCYVSLYASRRAVGFPIPGRKRQRRPARPSTRIMA